MRASYADKKITYDELESALSIYKEDMDFAEMGFYAPHFDFDTSELFQASIRNNRQQQKDLLRNKTTFGAIYCTTEWTVSGSKAEGNKMTTRGINLTARAFNSECDAAIANVYETATQDRTTCPNEDADHILPHSLPPVPS